MKIHLNQIPVDGLHLEGIESSDILDIKDQNVKCITPVRYVLDIGISGSGLFATGVLEIDLELECVSCLEKFPYLLKVDAFALQTELPNSETVDLTPYMREDILLNLPLHPHCDWNEEKTCAGIQKIVPGLKINMASKPLTEVPEAWDELNKLKAKIRK